MVRQIQKYVTTNPVNHGVNTPNYPHEPISAGKYHKTNSDGLNLRELEGLMGVGHDGGIRLGNDGEKIFDSLRGQYAIDGHTPKNQGISSRLGNVPVVVIYYGQLPQALQHGRDYSLGPEASKEGLEESVASAQSTAKQPVRSKSGFGYRLRQGVATLLIPAYFAAGCGVHRIELSGPNQRQGMESVTVVDIVGREPKQFGPFTIPYYFINPAQLIVDSHDFTKFVHDSYRIRCQEGGLVKALEVAQVPNHYAQRLLRAGCYDNSERGVHDALKKMTPEQRVQVTQELERILRQEMKNELIRVIVISEEEKNKFLKELDEIKGESTKGIDPEVRDGLALVISAGIWYGIGSAIDAAVSSGSKAKTPAATTPATTCPPVCAPPGPL